MNDKVMSEINTLNEKTEFLLNDDDYAIIVRANSDFEQYVPSSLSDNSKVSNDTQQLMLMFCLLISSYNEDSEAKELIDNITNHFKD